MREETAQAAFSTNFSTFDSEFPYSIDDSEYTRCHLWKKVNRDYDKKIGIVGYWATSISTVRTTVLSEKGIKTDLFPDLDITFRILDI